MGGWVVIIMPWPLAPLERAPVSIAQEAGWSLWPFWAFVEERKSPSPAGVFSKLAEHKCRKQISVWRGYPYVQSVSVHLGNVFSISISNDCRSQWPCGLRRRSAAARLLRSWVRIPLGAWMFVCCEYCVLSGRGLCDELITRPEESYRL